MSLKKDIQFTQCGTSSNGYLHRLVYTDDTLHVHVYIYVHIMKQFPRFLGEGVTILKLFMHTYDRRLLTPYM